MSEQAAAAIAEDLRLRILQEPDVILEDPDVMRALIAANDRASGGNVIDLRGVAMERLESRLARLEETHKSVIAAAYENLAGMNQVHRAIMAFLEPLTFEDFLHCLSTDVADILRVARVRLILESHDTDSTDLAPVSDVLAVVEPGFIDAYIGRANRHVTLRQAEADAPQVHGADWVRSEACIRLNFGEGRLPGMLAFASDDEDHFAPNQATDLLGFMGGVFERAMRRWLG